MQVTAFRQTIVQSEHPSSQREEWGHSKEGHAKTRLKPNSADVKSYLSVFGIWGLWKKYLDLNIFANSITPTLPSKACTASLSDLFHCMSASFLNECPLVLTFLNTPVLLCDVRFIVMHWSLRHQALHTLPTVSDFRNLDVSLLTSRILEFCMLAKQAATGWLCQDLLPCWDGVWSPLAAFLCAFSWDWENTFPGSCFWAENFLDVVCSSVSLLSSEFAFS